MSTGDSYLAVDLRDGLAAVRRIEDKINQILSGQQQLEERMATVSEALTAIANGMSGLEEDVQRLIDVATNENLSPEMQAAVDQIVARQTAMSDMMDSAVPPVTAVGEETQ